MAAPVGNKYALGNKGGRPEKYSDEWLKSEAKALLNWLEDDKHIFLGTFARERGYCRQNFEDYCKKSKEFSDAMLLAKAWQEEKLLVGALTRAFDAGQVRYTMARVCSQEWKASWDQPEDAKEHATTVIINKIEK